MLRRSLLLVTTLVACAPAAPIVNGKVDDACPIEPERYAIIDEGDVPLVITSTHAGSTAPLGCEPGDDDLRAIEPRVCDADLDATCASGPCRAGGGDRNARLLTFALVEELERCLGGRPSLALTEVSRELVDMNRDAHDVGGARCAMEDAAALPYWESFQRSVEGLVAHASSLPGHAMLIDLHTYQSLDAAPAPSIMIGTGNPVGTTLPVLKVEDPALDRVFGVGGLRRRLLASFGGTAVHPSALDAPLEGLFSGRYMVHRYSRDVDALQIELSDGVRDDALAAAHGIAEAICGAFGDRIKGSAR